MIQTERLLLREYTIDDFDALYEIMSDAETMQHYPAPFDETRIRRWIMHIEACLRIKKKIHP